MHSSTSNRQVTEFPNYKGDLCLQAEPSSCSWLRILLLQVQWHSRAADAQGIFNGESILLPSDMEFDAEAADCDDSMGGTIFTIGRVSQRQIPCHQQEWKCGPRVCENCGSCQRS